MPASRALAWKGVVSIGAITMGAGRRGMQATLRILFRQSSRKVQ